MFLISADFPVSTAGDFQEYPAIYYTNNQFYVFWVDYRYRSSGYISLFGARVSKTGTVIDTDGRLLYRDSASYNCNVAFDGTNFFVVTRNHC
jgi:hypothetical protein